MENQRDHRRANRTWRRVGQALRYHKDILLAVIFLTVIALLAIFAFLSPYDPDAMDMLHRLEGPTPQHWFGTDDLGRDYFTRVLYGGRISLLVGITAMLLTTGIGILVGTLTGWYGGIIDNVLMRLVDVISSIPWMVLVTVVSIFMRPGLQTIILVIGLFTWEGNARLIRAETMSVKKREYVLYAQSAGQSDAFIIWHHIIPSVLPTVIINATSDVASAIMIESSLSFLGLGVQQPMSSWGSLLNRAQGVLGRAPYMAILPGVMIILTVFSFNKLGGLIALVTSHRNLKE